MPKTKATASSAKDSAGKAAARNTDSGPASAASLNSANPGVMKTIQAGDLAAAMPFNANKPAVHGFANGLAPQSGATATHESRLPTAITLSEENSSEKVGGVAIEGRNATIEPLDRVRVDSSGQMPTTNQGVKIADNQNSLKHTDTAGAGVPTDYRAKARAPRSG
jgi:catalase